MARSCILHPPRGARSSGPARLLALGSALRGGVDLLPRPEAPNYAAPQRSPPRARYRYTHGLTCLKKSADRGKKKLRELPAGSLGARGCHPPTSDRPSTPARPAARGSHTSPPALGAAPGACRGRGWALTWHPLLSVQVLAVFTWVFKQVSGRKKEAKKKKKSNYANGLRTGSSALDLTPLPLELWSSPGRGFMGARHGYARSRRRSIAKLIKAVMSTFPATLRAGWAAPPSARPRGAGALPPPRLLPPLPAPPLFPLFLPLRAFSSLSSL